MSAVDDLFSKRRLTLISGPCVMESYGLCRDLAGAIGELAAKYGVSYIFKTSFDKANRTSINSFRGPGIEDGLAALSKLREELKVPVLTDIHLPEQAALATQAVDVLQIPAFLCRQTDIIAAAAKTGAPVNIKKGQFMAPEDMRHVVQKHRDFGGGPISVTERGVSFGYHNLVVDMRSLPLMREASQGAAVVFDATHSVQRPSAGNGVTAGDRHFAPVLARAAAAVGIDGLFCEVHFTPDQALSDGPNSLTLEMLERTLAEVSAIDAAMKKLSV